MKLKLSADELLRRFDADGGQVYHYKGQRRCYAATMRVGPFRLGHNHNSLTPAAFHDPYMERVTLKTWREVQKALLLRAKAMPAVEPTMAMLGEFLEAIDAHTLTRKQLGDHVRWWMFMLEVWCCTREAHEAFLYESHHLLDEALMRFAPQFAAKAEQR